VVEAGSGSLVEYPAGGGSPITLEIGLFGPQDVTVSAPPPRFHADTPPPGTSGQAYSYLYTAGRVVGEPSPRFRVVSGALPPGLELTSTGQLSGVPTAPGTYNFTVAAENAVAASDSPPQSVTIGP
jgi:hypothetical protein